jgi:hypothetical protein
MTKHEVAVLFGAIVALTGCGGGSSGGTSSEPTRSEATTGDEAVAPAAATERYGAAGVHFEVHRTLERQEVGEGATRFAAALPPAGETGRPGIAVLLVTLDPDMVASLPPEQLLSTAITTYLGTTHAGTPTERTLLGASQSGQRVTGGVPEAVTSEAYVLAVGGASVFLAFSHAPSRAPEADAEAVFADVAASLASGE